MNRFSFSDKYRLEVHWSKVNVVDGGLSLSDCILTGPAISDLVILSEKDSIRLDFASQYISLLKEYMVVNLLWEGLEHKGDKILLNNVVLLNKHLLELPEIKNTDYLVIDMSDHEDTKHNFVCSYKAYLIRSDGDKYNFRDK